MNKLFTAMAFAGAVVCVTPAQAAINIDLTPGMPAVFTSTSTGFFLTFTYQADTATAFDAILTAYASAGPCNNGCVPYDPNRIAVQTFIAGPNSITQRIGISVGISTGPVRDMMFRLENRGSSIVKITNLSTELSVLTAIPEPATWGLMLTGFAMTGYALRRRRARVAFA